MKFIIENKLVQHVLIIIIIFVGVAYVYCNFDMLNALRNISNTYLIYLLFATIVSFIVLGVNFRYVMSVFNIHLPFKEYFGLTISNTMFNYYIPARGGIVVRAYYLKEKYNFELSKYLSLLGGDYFINTFVSAFTAVVLLLLLYLRKNIFHTILFSISTGLLITLYFLYIIFNIFNRKINFISNSKILTKIKSILDGLVYYKKNPKIIVKIALSQLALIFFMGIRLYISFIAIGMNIDFLNILIVQSLIVFSMVFSITPGNIGIKEGIIGLLSSMVGVNMPEAIFAATIDRVIAIIVTFVFGLYYSKILLSDLITPEISRYKPK